jgi:hypothetical protein
MKSVSRLAVAALSLALAGGSAHANGYCVACSGPDATYRCTVEGLAAGVPADPATQILCIKQLATEGGHDRCSIEKFSQENCNGAEKIVSRGSLAPAESVTEAKDEPTPTAGPDAGTAANATPAEKKPETDEPPRTVEELAKNSVSSAKENFDKAGEAVTGTAEKAGKSIEGAGSAMANAAKKTWNCVSSFFSDC